MDEAIGAACKVLTIVAGRIFISMLTLRRWRGESLNGEEGEIYGAAGALSFVREGRRVITTTGQLFAGIAFYVLLLVGVLAYAAWV